jgi:hypothetical protein
MTLYKFGEYRFLVSTPKEIESKVKTLGGGWLISKCPPSHAIAFSSPKFTENRSGEWLFCNFIKRLVYLGIIMEVDKSV